jgi:hypothetical protein
MNSHLEYYLKREQVQPCYWVHGSLYFP